MSDVEIEQLRAVAAAARDLMNDLYRGYREDLDFTELADALDATWEFAPTEEAG